uniref:Glycosyltransferase n=1 Tax=Paeonia delavayi TaxID=40707 RepID=A0A1U9XQU9_9MAGN|nr:anthocyanidin 5,3-O-glucosyltransferase [Paeonia delavayi]
MVELGKLLLHHYNHKFSITILLITDPLDTPNTTSYVHRITQTHPSISFCHFPLVSVDTSPTIHSRAAIKFEFIRLNSTNVLHSLNEISKVSTIKALVIDLFCTSALPIADELGIPTYYFFTSGASVLALFLYFPVIHKQIKQSFKDLKTTDILCPGLPPFPASHMPEPMLDRDDPAYDYMLYFCDHLSKSNGILVNTFDDLEPIALKIITAGSCVPEEITPPIYCVGPLTANPNESTGNDCLSWLDMQPSRSVVFLCFGSRGSLSSVQVKEIANGLETSGQRFLWVLKIHGGEINVDLDVLMPEGFLERTTGRGLVVKSWAPQVAVLSHESVGGFVTHCGWNSVLEAVVAGVPMVAWPLYAEQHVNKAVLVEDMKMAIPLEQREEDGWFVTADELEKRLRDLMDSDPGKELRERSWKMREMAVAAWRKFGSSDTALAKLVEVWKHPDKLIRQI